MIVVKGPHAEQGASEPVAKRRRRWRRYSLVTLAWLITVAALCVGLYQTGKEVVPLRDSVRRLRSQLGFFPVDDPSKAHVKRMPVKVPQAWEWRLILPATQAHHLHVFVGAAPDPLTVGESKWFEMLRHRSAPMGGNIGYGEVSYEAVLLKYGDKWWLRIGPPNTEGSTLALPPEFDWLSDDGGWFATSDASYEKVNSFDAGESIVLLNVERRLSAARDGEDDDEEDSTAAERHAAPSPRIVVWIGDPSPPTPAGRGLVVLEDAP